MQKRQIPKQKQPEAPVEKRHSPLREPRKTFQKDGHWIEKPNKTAILVCECGNRYIKTRRNQDTCLRCFSLAHTH